MTDLIVIKVKVGAAYYLAAADEETSEIINGMRDSEIVTYKRKRNPKNHRRYFAFIKQAFDMQERFTNIEVFRKYLQCAAGHYDEAIDSKGRMIFMPRSIEWSNLDETEFKPLFDQVVKAFADEFGSELDAEQFNNVVGFV